MGFQAKRELLAQVAPRYQHANHAHKSLILDEFVAATGYARKYAIRLLSQPVSPPAPIKRPRQPRYGPAVQDALLTAWAATNFICAKRLVPFLPELLPSLERHGHLQLTDEVRAQLLAISPATADRILRLRRQAEHPRGISTTKSGKLLKHQVPIRTFTDWNDASPGFVEADLVAHCGSSAEGSFLYTLVLTDVATGWTDCLALPYRSQHVVVQALGHAKQLLPFPLLGLDTDNGGEFLNAEVFTFCEREQITFTRGRAYRKNDQCYIEQKNGAIVRQLVGYDRFEGERAFRQLSELYGAVRLYVNFFQPSMKLVSKRRDGSKVSRSYDAAQTPLHRLLASGVLTNERRLHFEQLSVSLDPVRLLEQITRLQDALWRHAIVPTPAQSLSVVDAPSAEVRFIPGSCVSSDEVSGEATLPLVSEPTCGGALPSHLEHTKRAYRRTKPQQGPRWWRTRADPFEKVWEEICGWLAETPERTAKSVLLELQQRYPGQYPDEQLRTLQRRVQAWRAEAILVFDEQWLKEEVLIEQILPRPLRGRIADVPQLSAAEGVLSEH
jgi:hypothetical protein